MNLELVRFLAQPEFVIPWCGVGAIAAAFWGIGAPGLLVGFVVTCPMNGWLVRIGWKHGMA